MTRPDRHGQAAGFALVPALFLIVVLGALALVGVRVGTAQQHAVTMALMEARAMAAARTGVEFAAYRALNGGWLAANTTLSLTEGALNGFSVVVTCHYALFSNGSGWNNSYAIQATATYGTYGQPGYVRRVMSSSVTDAT